jgi:hypothetical protein
MKHNKLNLAIILKSPQAVGDIDKSNLKIQTNILITLVALRLKR